MDIHWLLILQLASSSFLTGLIWFVQVVHYPLMRHLHSDEFCRYEQQHIRRTTWVVAPAMLLEAVLAIAIAMLANTATMRTLAVVGIAMLAIIWLSTWLLQVPCHNCLSRQRDESQILRLVRTNWLRTAAWTLRSTLSATMLIGSTSP